MDIPINISNSPPGVSEFLQIKFNRKMPPPGGSDHDCYFIVTYNQIITSHWKSETATLLGKRGKECMTVHDALSFGGICGKLRIYTVNYHNNRVYLK